MSAPVSPPLPPAEGETALATRAQAVVPPALPGGLWGWEKNVRMVGSGLAGLCWKVGALGDWGVGKLGVWGVGGLKNHKH